MSAARLTRPAREHGHWGSAILLGAVLAGVLMLALSSVDRSVGIGPPLLPQAPANSGASVVQQDAPHPPMPEPGLDR